ncbi:MAG: hypothetical protein CO158_01840 [Piscirickettsiaceae bacterium CG_4_9_14_3_um_filter_43_564]|nr:MAG: hypothetical protein AUK56_09235 [Thiomicrospira sp. CG2_30_44_34]PIU39567.1 MAG: hypothetical protein COT01_00815 [Piscirickettsiaceae bacterium CG07_land_8_20_14_0_80_44_28]PIW57564.1 MAG: hypothetical protein COW14_05265 [Piscirickettsiaceae bacterium CG12_big_fil_rev_8_21_14_0_65_44_934]PIW77848.1 MAG: hypothetical protein CO000_04735 [Piscirickettsiaceae bacterium CG_4_8_14_3_um_filter_44_38]PIX80725.1 MAG: hypothetical protein COZ36_01635 [Piscirickettsiaceae bacterium CG_4_10_14_
MNGRWAYYWVQIMAHNLPILWFALMVGLLLMASGLFVKGSPIQLADAIWVLGSLMVMSGVAIKLFDSLKTAGLLLVVTSLIWFGVLGCLAWLGVSLTQISVLALVVVVTLVMGNLVHLLASVLREMARGAFQHDAVAESLKLNAMPILLSNLTTTFGFSVAAFFDSQLIEMAWVVGLGALISYLAIVTWVPLILLSWFLEFRVGHYDDRHGFLDVVRKMQRYPRWLQAMVWLSLTLLLISGVYLSQFMVSLIPVAMMLFACWMLLWLVWRDWQVSLMAILTSLAAIVLVLTGYFSVQSVVQISAVVLIVPLGIVLDDSIHYFSRYLRSKQGFFNTAENCHRYALSSVGRPIWLTTQLLAVGLLVLGFHPDEWIRQASLVTLLATLLASYIILLWLPAFQLKS